MNTTTPIEYWRTRDGRKAVVFPEFSTSKTTKGFLKGDNNHFWSPHIWERQLECSKEVFNSNLLEPWTDELDFDASCLPKWAGWIAMDESRIWHWFSDKPTWNSECFWKKTRGFHGDFPLVFNPTGYHNSAQDSLHQIVDGKAIKA